MSTTQHQIASDSHVCSTACSGQHQRNYQSFAALLAHCNGNLHVIGGFPSQRPSMWKWPLVHYGDVIMGVIITSLTIVYSTIYSDADERKHQSSASLAFVWGIHRNRWIPRTNGQEGGKCFHLMTSSYSPPKGRVMWKEFPCHNISWFVFCMDFSFLTFLENDIVISPVSEGSGDVMVLRRSRPPPAARNGVNAITQKPRDGLFSNLVYTLVVIVSWPD